MHVSSSFIALSAPSGVINTKDRAVHAISGEARTPAPLHYRASFLCAYGHIRRMLCKWNTLPVPEQFVKTEAENTAFNGIFCRRQPVISPCLYLLHSDNCTQLYNIAFLFAVSAAFLCHSVFNNNNNNNNIKA